VSKPYPGLKSRLNYMKRGKEFHRTMSIFFAYKDPTITNDKKKKEAKRTQKGS